MSAMVSQIIGVTIVYATVSSDTHQRKYPSSASLAFEWLINQCPVISPHKGPETRKMIPFDDFTMNGHNPWSQSVQKRRSMLPYHMIVNAVNSSNLCPNQNRFKFFCHVLFCILMVNQSMTVVSKTFGQIQGRFGKENRWWSKFTNCHRNQNKYSHGKCN